jgi:hypothetical protein
MGPHPRMFLLLTLATLGASCRAGAGAGEPDGTTNPGRLWFAGPESNLHLSAVEPTTPF